MSKLKILQITNRIPWPLDDGGNIATYSITRGLHQAGHEMTLMSLNTNKHYQDPAVIKDVHTMHALDIDTSLSPWGLLKGLILSKPYNVERFRSHEFAGMIHDVMYQELMDREQYDIVQLEGSYMLLYASVVRAMTFKPIILRSHNIENQIWRRVAQNTRNPLKKLYLRNMAQKIANFEWNNLRHLDGIVAITDQDADWFDGARTKAEVRTINAGVDLKKFAPDDEIRFAPKLIFLGSLEWQPNQQGLTWFLDKIWKEVYARHPHAELHVAGKNPPERMRKLSRPGMTFHGMVPDAAKFMQRGHIFIVPLLSGGGMRLKIIEAMAAGKAVISTSIGAEGIACTHEKDIFLEEKPEAWIKRIDSLLTEKKQSVEVAKAGLQLARDRYGWEAITGQFVQFYHDLLQKQEDEAAERVRIIEEEMK